MDLITLSSHEGLTDEREDSLEHLFPKPKAVTSLKRSSSAKEASEDSGSSSGGGGSSSGGSSTNSSKKKKRLRPFKFKDKQIVFVSARVHPGETQSR